MMLVKRSLLGRLPHSVYSHRTPHPIPIYELGTTVQCKLLCLVFSIANSWLSPPVRVTFARDTPLLGQIGRLVLLPVGAPHGGLTMTSSRRER